MQLLTLGLIQTDILWEDISGNLNRLYPHICTLKEKCDLIVFPEMFTTGFSMRTSELAEATDGLTMTTLQQWANEMNLAFCGSFICREGEKIYNRGFFITPMQRFFYDKHHLFRMGEEPLHFDAGNKHLLVHFKGWNISLQICYDLRFPVWCRNVNNNYDLQIFVASWPAARQRAWNTLLQARAIENEAYVAGVNRTGVDGNGLKYAGGSAVYDMKGELLSTPLSSEESILVCSIHKEKLLSFRKKFPAWQDADSFKIKED